LSDRGLRVAAVLALVFAVFVLGVLIHTRMQHRSADQEILIQKSHQN
jgi:hypothetical protein